MLNYKARSRKLGAAVLVLAVAAMLMATGLPGKLEQAHAGYVDPTEAKIGFHTSPKITKLIYPTIGNPAIVKQDTTLTVEWDPREGNVTEGAYYPVCTDFIVTATSTNGGNGAITRSLPSNGVQGYSTQWPTLVPTPDDLTRPPSKKIYLVTVTIPETLPADLYDLHVSCMIEGMRYYDVQTNSLDVVQQFKDKLNFVQLTDIHVFGPECNYISSNQKERTARTITWNSTNGYGATFYHKAIQQINRIHPDFVVFTGDYDFGQKYLHQDRGAGWGDTTEYEYEQSWFYQETQKLEVPVYIVMGNHDGYNYSFDHGGPWQQDWFGNWTRLYGPLYHTFNYGPDYKFFAINTMGWTSPQRTLEDYFGIILQPNKYLGQVGSNGDLYEDGLDWNRTGARTIDIPTFSGQLGWLRDQLAASSSQDAKARIMAMHHDPWKDNGSGSMWMSGTDPITGDILNMGNGEGRLSLMRLAKDYKVQLMIHGHDHSDCTSVDDTNAAQLDWTAGGGQVISANTTSTSFQADGDSTEYPGYRRVWLEDGNVLQAPAGAESLNYVEPYHSWPFYAGTNVGSNTNLHNLSAPALQQSWSATPGPTTEDVTCSLTSVYNKPLTDAYLEFPMKYLSGGYYYTVSNGTFGETFNDHNDDPDPPSFRMNQVFTNMGGPQSNKLVRVRKSASPDTTTPTGSVSINDGAASTDIADVTLTLDAVDTESGVGEMMVSNDSGFTGAEWQRFQTSIPWTLTGGSGTKTVYVKYRDRAMPPHEVTKTDTIEFSAPPTDARITSVNPNNSDRGMSLVVDIYGANTHFVNGTSRARFSFPGYTPLPFDVWSTTVHNPTWATASIHIPTTVSMGAWDVEMLDGELTMPLVGGFTVNGPYISAVDPVQGAVGTTLNVDITGVGTGFIQGTSQARFWRDGANVPGLTVNSTTRISSTLVRANITIMNGCDTGPADVTVYTMPDNAIPLMGGFEVVERVPRVRSVTPQSGVLGQTLDVAILGSQTHFDGANPVATFGAGITVHSVTVTDALQASANITISPSATAGTRNVNLTTTGETPAPLTAGFTVEYPDPTVVYIAPNEAPNSGSIHISVLDGTGLRSGATVKLKLGTEADIVATNVVVAGDHNSLSCDFNVNGKRGGAWDVVVTNPDLKSAMLPGGFTINANPTITSITPATGVNTGSVAVTNLAGTNFYTGARVRLTLAGQTDIDATDVTVVSTTRITCTLPISGKAAGQWNVVYDNSPDQPTPATRTNGFRITGPPPTLTSVTDNHAPNNATYVGASLVGTNFRTGATVKLTKSGQTAINATPPTGLPGSPITCDLPLTGARVGTWNVVVTNTDLTSATLPNAFTVQYPNAPTVTVMNPMSGLQGQVVEGVTVTGTFFYNPVGSNPPAVKLTKTGQTDIVATNVQIVGTSPATSLTCDFDLSGAVQADDWVLVVTNDDGQSGTWQGAGNTFHVDQGQPPKVDFVIPTSGPVGSSVTVTGSNFGVSLKNAWVSFNGKRAVRYTDWGDGSITCQVPNGASTGPVKVHNVSGDGTGQVFTVTSGSPPNPTKTGPTPIWYLAEGTSDYGFDTYITIENPNTSAVTAMVIYMTKAGPKTRPDLMLPAMSQTVINPRNDIGATDFSTKVECKEGKTIAVDRRMTWVGPGSPSQEGHSSVGVTSPAKTWYLAEGSSKWGFESWLLIQNPGTTVAHCTVTYMIEGAGPVSVPHDIPAGSRASFNMETEPGVGACDASIKVVSKDVPVIPERAMYRNNRREGHDSIGTTTPARDYYLAEGTTDWGFTTYVLVQNPNTTPTTVNITYMTPKGPVPQDPFTMDPNSRKTINVNNLPGMSKTDCSIHVAGTAPIIAERAMYWGAGTPLGEACHDSIGMASPHSAFFLPDGETGNGMETWTLVQNPNKTNVTVEICYLTPDGKGIVKFNDIINANSRKSYNMADKIPAGRAAVMVTSRTSNARIMVERAMYWNARGAGTDTIGGYADL